MSNLVAIAYPDLGTAQTVAGELGQLTKEKSITLDDMVIIERRPDGKVKLHQSMSTAGAGAAGGALWGGLIGLIFLAPLLGMAVGAAAVVVLVRQSTPDKVIPRVSQYGGEVIQSSLDNEAETRLQEALDAHAAAG